MYIYIEREIYTCVYIYIYIVIINSVITCNNIVLISIVM